MVCDISHYAGFFFPNPLLFAAVDLDSSLQWNLEMSHLPVGTEDITLHPVVLEEIPTGYVWNPTKKVGPVSRYLNTGGFAAEGSFQLHLSEAH